MKNIEAREPPFVAEGKSLWGEEAQHNERAEWLRREEKRKIMHKDWRPLQIMEITLYLIKYKITGLKLSQLLTDILQKTLMQ